MSKKCAKCEKTVYPIEELKCLDKVWHKSCFKCWECGMTLNMKNYKGYDKKPYCGAHYPKQTFTAVKETPEMARIAQNTKLQSQVQYHKDFESNKKNFTVIADDPETKRLMKNTEKTSLVKYHEEFERNLKGVKTSVTDDPELLRLKKNTAISSEIEYRGVREKQAEQETRRGNVLHDQGPAARRAPGSISEYNPLPPDAQNHPSPYSARGQGHQVYNSTTTGPVRRNRIASYHGGTSTHLFSSVDNVEPGAARNVGSIHDYDPVGEPNTAPFQQAKQWQESVPDPHSQQGYSPAGNGTSPAVPMVPLGHPLNVTVSQPRHEAGVGDYYPAPQQQQQPPAPQPPQTNGQRFRCVYDYNAGDSDEVSFVEEDIIINPDPIDSGWMYGTVLRTGQRGMLPANYVEPLG